MNSFELLHWHAAIPQSVVIVEVYFGVGAVETYLDCKRGNLLSGEIDLQGPRIKKLLVCETQFIVAEFFKGIPALNWTISGASPACLITRAKINLIVLFAVYDR